jgi:hypothetical protein
MVAQMVEYLAVEMVEQLDERLACSTADGSAAQPVEWMVDLLG